VGARVRAVSALDDARTASLVRLMKAGAARGGEVSAGGLTVRVPRGVCHPAPFGGVSFAPLFEAALEGLTDRERVLDLGTGCGIWALLAARSGAEVWATDLPHVDLSVVAASARANHLTPPVLRAGDLFEPVKGERFDRVLFNPPFHLGEPADDAERAYLGGADGEVVRRFSREVSEYRTEGGAAYLILPRRERAAYADALAAHRVEERASRWLPVLGRCYLLALR